MIAGPGIELQIVQSEDLVQMRQILFRHVGLEIRLDVGEGRERPAVVEGVRFMRHNHKDGAAQFQNSPPLLQRAQRVG